MIFVNFIIILSFIDNNDKIANRENNIHRLPYMDVIFYYLNNHAMYCVQCDIANGELAPFIIKNTCVVYVAYRS